MNNFWKFLQYGYLIIAVIFLVEAALAWKDDINKALFMLGFSTVSYTHLRAHET